LPLHARQPVHISNTSQSFKVFIDVQCIWADWRTESQCVETQPAVPADGAVVELAVGGVLAYLPPSANSGKSCT
jgi:hypothetical protein